MALRAEAYYEALGDELSDEEWFFAVREANREQTFFPSPSELLEYGRLFRKQADPPERRTEAQREAQREEARQIAARGLELIRDAMRRAPELPAAPSRIERMRERLGFQSVGAALVEPNDEQQREVRELAEQVAEATK